MQQRHSCSPAAHAAVTPRLQTAAPAGDLVAPTPSAVNPNPNPNPYLLNYYIVASLAPWSTTHVSTVLRPTMRTSALVVPCNKDRLTYMRTLYLFSVLGNPGSFPLLVKSPIQ